MGTRSTVKFYSEFDQEEPVVSVYQQYDGYINGVGYDLAIFLKEKTIINGIHSGQTMDKGFANGMGCLAAQYVAENKTEIGCFYLTTKDDYQEYNYEVRFIDDNFVIKIKYYDNIFEGTPEQLLNFKEI